MFVVAAILFSTGISASPHAIRVRRSSSPKYAQHAGRIVYTS